MQVQGADASVLQLVSKLDAAMHDGQEFQDELKVLLDPAIKDLGLALQGQPWPDIARTELDRRKTVLSNLEIELTDLSATLLDSESVAKQFLTNEFQAKLDQSDLMAGLNDAKRL